MADLTLTVNSKTYQVDLPKEVPLLWVLRDLLDLTGTKFGCGVGTCGSCTVHVDGKAYRSCQITPDWCKEKKITTIEGLSEGELHPVQKAWVKLNVPQCGYCQAGQIMTAAHLLQQFTHPTGEQIDDAMSQVICRCGTYKRIHEAVNKAAGYMAAIK